ncbi:MAG: hypothetical protein A3C55_02760 [Gammaproteobacteria bacterium RIFCSPHIGHO2_02_FULL_42_13]|nr:MAG: hypothetical protein A3C55_02760 [Gammaproteobacteria bacterium RIFCSPHIGHO2_02_FULL_42_13]OGT67592.1 MAG: hypothetical protein A3H43_06260 [Gammaproteobacteria bacterium RIFCSPLOWO2_02_FULL_42_9]
MSHVRSLVVLVFSFCFLSFFPLILFAWGALGHQLVAQIAYEHLTGSAASRVNQLADNLMKDNKGAADFIKIATWPDDIRSNDVTAFNGWHYIAQPFSPDGQPLAQVDYENVVWAILQSEKTLASPHSTEDQKAMFLGFLVHFVGDIHQPLHVSTRVTKQFPSGDMGGNDFLIQSPIAANLHMLWDHMLGLYDNSALDLQTMASQIETDYPVQSFGQQVQDMDPMDWATEGFAIANTFVYNGVQFGAPVSQQYITAGQKIAEQRVALAGYRLAYTLNKIFQ